MNILPATFTFFKSAGVFRVKTPEKARERFDEAYGDYLEDNALPRDADVSAYGPAGETLFAALMERNEEVKREKIAADIVRDEKRAKREADKAARPVAGGLDSRVGFVTDYPAGRYVLTSAQNNTSVHPGFAALSNFCRVMGATLMAGKLTYNKNGFSQPGVDDGDLWYAEEIRDYLVSGQINLDNRFHFVADANVIPTAKNPINGFDGITPSGIGAIIPATKIALKVSAALKGAATKVIVGTGAITKPNYILRKTGAIAAMEHNIGAVFVDTVTGEIRHLEVMEGSDGFFDVTGFYSGDTVEPLNSVAALQFGDIHAEKMDAANLDAAVALIDRLNPENIVLHDVLDFSSRNHHNIKDPMFMHAQMVAGNTVRRDLEKLATVVDTIADGNSAEIHIIESNHDLAINTWLKTVDPKTDPINAVVYHKCMLAKLEHTEARRGDYFNMLRFGYDVIGCGRFADGINFHETDESVIIAGVEMGCHGHNGANGAKGSPVGFRSLGIAMNTGHTHSPGINGRVYTAGVTASLEMGYNVGASSWAIAHVVTYHNGQRQIIFG